jgi:hypothetical protein
MRVDISTARTNHRIRMVVPAGLGRTIFCVVQIGILWTGMAVATTMLCLLVVLRLFPRVYRNRLRRTSNLTGSELIADASNDGNPGLMSIFHDHIEFVSRKGSTLYILKNSLAVADLVSVRNLVVATRATLTGTDGTQTEWAIIAPAEDIAQALAHSGQR